MSRPAGLRERKKQERRRRLEQAALELFETHGFASTTIDDIAAAVDVSPRTFFSYFDTKEDVVLADYADRLARIVGELERQPSAGSPWNALEAAFATVAVDYEAQREELIRRFSIMADSPSVYARSLHLQAGWEEALAQALARRTGAGLEDPEPRLLAAAALAGMRASVRQWAITGYRTPMPAILAAAFARLGAGLAGLAGG